MNKKRPPGVKPLLHQAFISVTHDDQDRFCVKESSIRGLGDIHEAVAETFQKAVETRIFAENPHITTICITPIPANDSAAPLPLVVIQRPTPAA